MGLKDQLNENPPSQKTFTLDPQDVQFLAHVNKFVQAELDTIQQHIAASFLNHIATTRFGYGEGKDLRFNFDPKKTSDNLTIIEISEE